MLLNYLESRRNRDMADPWSKKYLVPKYLVLLYRCGSKSWVLA